MELKNCLNCKNIFYKPYYQGRKKWNSRKFCSFNCYHKYDLRVDTKKGKYQPCLVCGKLKYYAPNKLDNNSKRFCSQKCKIKGQFKEKKSKICIYCGKEFLPRGHSLKIRFCSHSCGSLGRKFKGLKGERNYKWKGNKVGYNALHTWVYREKGNPPKCQICGESKKMRHWANIDRKYQRKLEDFISLCVSCHKKYDLDKNYITD